MTSDPSRHSAGARSTPHGGDPSGPFFGPDDVAFEASDLRCVRQDRTLFEGFGFRLNPGELIQIQGANGSGKTSLLRLLCLLALPDAGEVRWGGVNAEEIRPDFLRELTYIGHTHGVKADLTAHENLKVAAALAGGITMDPDEALARIGLAGFEDTPARELSAGQTRRVALARLLIHPTRLWILDEPFTALDPRGKAMVEGILTEHCDRGGMAIITTHQPVDIGDHAVTHIRLGSGEEGED